MIPERRSSPRLTPKEFTFIQLEQEFSGRVLNFSEHGLCFESVSPVSETDFVQFWFSYLTKGQVDGVGKLVWLRKDNNVGGIQFVHLSRSSRQRLNEWVEYHKNENSGAVARRLRAQASENASPSESPAAAHAIASAPSIQAPAPLAGVTAKGSEGPTAAPPPRPPNPVNAPPIVSKPVPHDLQPAQGTAFVRTAPPAGATADDSAPAYRKWPKSSPAADAPVLESMPAPGLQPLPKPAAFTEPSAHADLAPALPSHTSLVQLSPPTEPSTIPPLPEIPSGTDSMMEVEGESDNLATELIPMGRHISALRSQLLRGALLGALTCAVLAVPFLRLSKGGWKNILSDNSLPPAVSASTSPESAVKSTISNPNETMNVFALPTNRSRVRNSSELRSTHSVKEAEDASRGSLTPDRSEATAAAPSTPPILQPAGTNGATDARFTRYAFVEPSPNGPAADSSRLFSSGSSSSDSLTSSASPIPAVNLASASRGFEPGATVEIIPVGGDAHPAKLIRSIPPVYPDLARNQHVSGEVVIQAEISTSGKVTNLAVLSGPPALRHAALSAVQQWLYQPAMLNGKPTASRVSVTIRFRAD